MVSVTLYNYLVININFISFYVKKKDVHITEYIQFTDFKIIHNPVLS